MKIVAFGTSNNRQSINRSLAAYTARLHKGANVEMLDIIDYEMPIYSAEREQALGQPPQALAFMQKIADADALVISFAEHNGSYTAAYKNLFDWCSLIDRAVFQQKPALFLATSPGPNGAADVLTAALGSASHFGADVIASLSVPRFHNNFDTSARWMINPVLRHQLEQAMVLLGEAVNAEVKAARDAA
jgi:chromate reductase